MPEDYPDFPHHTQIKAYLDAYADAFGLLDRIEFENGVARAEPTARRRLGDHRPGRRRPGASTCSWSPTATTGTRGRPEFPGEFTGESIHSHHYIDPTDPLDLTGKRILVVGLGNSAADIAVELSGEGAAERGHALDPVAAPGSCRSTSYGLPADKYFATSPHIPLAWQRKVVQKMQFMTGSNPELYGLPKPNHKFFEAHPTQSVELPLRLGSGDVVPKPATSTRLDGDTVHFEDGTSERLRRDRLRHRLQHHLPVLRRGVPQRAGQPDPAVQADVQARHRRPGVHGLRPGDADAVPVRRGAGPAARGVRRRAATRCPTVDEMERVDRRRRRRSTSATCSTGRGTPSRSTTSSTSTTCGPRRSRPAAARARGRSGGDAHERPAAPAATAGVRRCSSRSTTTCARSEPRVDQHRRHLARAPASPARRSTSTSRTRPARSRRSWRRCTTSRSRPPTCSRGDGTPAERVEAMVRALFVAWERHEHLYRAMLDARATSTDRARAVGHRPGVVRRPSSPG